jgi:hypothetical protein
MIFSRCFFHGVLLQEPICCRHRSPAPEPSREIFPDPVAFLLREPAEFRAGEPHDEYRRIVAAPEDESHRLFCRPGPVPEVKAALPAGHRVGAEQCAVIVPHAGVW